MNDAQRGRAPVDEPHILVYAPLSTNLFLFETIT